MSLDAKVNSVDIYNVLQDILTRLEKLERNYRSVKEHSDMDSLDVPADHDWALLVDGTRALTGNMAVDAGITIDGKDVSTLADGVHTHTYMPLAGGNFTGSVTLNADLTVDGVDVSDIINAIICSDAAGYVVNVGTTTVDCTTAYGKHAGETEYHWYYGDVTVNYSQTFNNRQIPIAMAYGAWCSPITVTTTYVTFRVYRIWGSASGVTVYYAIIGA